MAMGSAPREARHARHVLLESGLRATEIPSDPADPHTEPTAMLESLATRFRGCRAIAVFVSSAADFPALGEGENEAAVIGVSEGDLENVPQPSGKRKLLKASRLGVESLGTLELLENERGLHVNPSPGLPRDEAPGSPAKSANGRNR